VHQRCIIKATVSPHTIRADEADRKGAPGWSEGEGRQESGKWDEGAGIIAKALNTSFDRSLSLSETFHLI
jgi:hypothetical protein